MLTFKSIFSADFLLEAFKQHTQWWRHVGIQVYYGLAEFPLLTRKQHTVMVPCWPLCWASLVCLLIWWKICNLFSFLFFSSYFLPKPLSSTGWWCHVGPFVGPPWRLPPSTSLIIRALCTSPPPPQPSHIMVVFCILYYCIVHTSPPTPPSSHITARWTQKSPNHPKPFKSATSRFWVTLFPFHSFSYFHHTRSYRNGRKIILKHFPY